MSSRLAVVLFNLGGPDSLKSVQPFLFNLFNDPAIIGIPNPMRRILASLISRRRAPVARQIYAQIGGKSPLLKLTQDQALALHAMLKDVAENVEVFVCMRYWHPMAAEVAKAVKDYNPDKIVLLPLYPQFSTTTVLSSFQDWNQAAEKAKLLADTHAICCYPCNRGLIEAQAAHVMAAIKKTKANTRILFSAHGLPRKIVNNGDPYQWQIEQTARAVISFIGGHADWIVCYQSRVGPLEWIGPSTEEELARAAADGVGVIVVPIAFVSEHSETLVELDLEYKELAKDLGVPNYYRIPALGIDQSFIEGLASLIREVCKRADPEPYGGMKGGRFCPIDFSKCPISRALE